MREKYIYMFKNTRSINITFFEEFDLKIVGNTSKFGVRNLKGGHFRRPEIAGAKMYGERDVSKYIKNERNASIQRDITQYALKLLSSQTAKGKGKVLDIGCGCGISSRMLQNAGYFVTGVDISSELLVHAKLNDHFSDYVQSDVSKGLNFTLSSFQFAISISVLQWFIKDGNLARLFRTLFNVLDNDGKAVLQFYPKNAKELDLVLKHAEKYFYGCVIGDYPTTNRGMKLFLYLFK